MAGFKNQAQRPLRRPQTRTIDGCLRRRADGADNQYELSFSSEEPYVRWGTPEILDHSPSAVDLARLNEIGVLLFNHDTYSVIGKVVEASVENGRGVAIVEMDTDEFSLEIQQKMDSGTLKGVSVRYSVGSWEEVSAGSTSADGKYTGPCDIARKWEPLEISIVSVPADPTVGVGRSDNYQQEEDYQNMEPENSTPITQAAEQQRSIPAAPPAAQETNHNVQSTAQSTSKEDIQRAERQRASDITAACREFGLDNKADEFIRSDKSVADVNAAILDHLRKNKGPLDVRVQRDEGDKFREAAAHGLLLRGSVPISDPVPGANDFRRMRLRDLMNYCARKEGIAEPELWMRSSFCASS